MVLPISTIAFHLAFTLSLISPSYPDPVKPRGRSFGRMTQDQSSPYSRFGSSNIGSKGPGPYVGSQYGNSNPSPNLNQNNNQYGNQNRNQGQSGPSYSSPPAIQPPRPAVQQNLGFGFGAPGNLAPQRQIAYKDPFIVDFENYVAHLPISGFEGDALLLQFPDRLNGRTTYRHLNPADIENIVYETSQMDANSEVVILKADEDKMPPSTRALKRVYVVLRRALLLDPRLYYVAYVYVTDPPEGSIGIHNLGGRKVYLEWDFWDHREVDDAAAKQLEYAFGCSNTIFVPCASNETLDYPSPNKIPPPRNLGNAGDGTGGGGPRVYPTSDGRNLNVADGYDPNEFMDIYWDLEKELKAERPTNTNPQSAVPMLPLGRSADAGMFTSVMNKGSELLTSTSNMVSSMVDVMYKAGCGLTKQFGGLFGGLGTGEADTGGVTSDLGIEGSDGIFDINAEEENQELEAEVKEPTAGGLGGLLSAALEEYGKADAGRSINTAWDTVVEERPYVQFGWRMANDVNAANDPFVGYGGCRYHRVTPQELDRTVTETDLLRVYKTALKTQCVLYDGEFLQEILNRGLLRSQLDKTFRLVKTSPHFQLEKLNVKQLKELLRGVELYIWSKTYAQELRSPTPSTTAPDGSTLSRTIFTLGQAFLSATGLAQADLYPLKHGFKLGRNMVKTLKRAYLKLLEDIQLLTEGDTGFEREINFNDRVYVMSIIQYLIHGVLPVFIDNASPQKNFEDFYRKNKPFLEDRVNSQTHL